MSYWHSKIKALLGRSYVRLQRFDPEKGMLVFDSWPDYYIYYGRQPICSVEVRGSPEAIVRFGKWAITLDRPPDVPYYARQVVMGYIFKHLKGVENLSTIEERAKVFATKCKLLGGNTFETIEVRNEREQ